MVRTVQRSPDNSNNSNIDVLTLCVLTYIIISRFLHINTVRDPFNGVTTLKIKLVLFYCSYLKHTHKVLSTILTEYFKLDLIK